ncbi:hypothetical protein [Acidicapsa ligni]|uniref:hypothetical protein n=1 Tax=Acidicapsa ligni TaxID=542300 RepID=UPI0021E0DC33|nr:hypothetical protein [Acidicapsa ligni]
MQKTLKSYFFWTHQRGSFHYDVMVTLILAFIFVTPHLWNYGDKPPANASFVNPIQVTGDGDHGIIVTVQYNDVHVDPSANYSTVSHALQRAIEPVTGDAVAIVRWETVWDSSGRPTVWKVWARR